MEVTCPKLFKVKSNSLDNLVIAQKEKILADINILLGENVSGSELVIKEAEKLFYDFLKPTDFNPKSVKNIFADRDNSFEKVCVALEKYGTVSNPKELTVYEFYKRIEIVQENVRTNNK